MKINEASVTGAAALASFRSSDAPDNAISRRARLVSESATVRRGPEPLSESRHLTIGCLSVQLLSSSARGRTVLDDVADSYGLPSDASDAVDATIELRAVSKLPARPPGWDCVTSYGTEVHVYQRDARYVIAGPRVVTRLDTLTGRGEVLFDGALLAKAEAHGHVVVGLTILARHAAFYPLHAACVSRGANTVIIAGPSDSGKSTMAYNLVRAGWSFLSDDTILLTASADGTVDAVPFRRRFALDSSFAEFRPEIETASVPMIGDPAKLSVAVDSLHPGRLADRCSPTLIVFPELSQSAESAVLEKGLSDAFIGLAAQSALRELADAQTRAHHLLLSNLLRQAPQVKLLAGRDLLNDPARVDSVITGALPSTASVR